MKKSVKITLTVVGFICIIIMLFFTFIKLKKPSFCRENFSKFDYVTKDFNIIKNYKEYEENEKNFKKLYDDYRGEFSNKNAKKPLKLGGGYFSNQGVHPDIVKKNKDGKDIYYMAYTPYPFGRDKYENPFLVKSENGVDFRAEKGVRNPLVSTPEDFSKGGHLSDTDLLYNNGKFMLYYVYNKKEAIGETKFYVIDSPDGVNWSEPKKVYETREGYSPTVIKDDNDFKMWHIESEGNLVRSTSKDGYVWTTYKKCKIDLGEWLAWHIDIQKTDIGYEGLVCSRNPKLKTRALFYMLSEDGLNWKVSKKPILFKSDKGWDDKEIYRSTFIKENNKYRVWYSARGDFYKWSIGYTEYTKDEIKNLDLR